MYKKYARDLYTDPHDHTTDDTDYAYGDVDTSSEKYNRISRAHEMDLLNAKFNVRPSIHTSGKTKTRSQTISSIYRTPKKDSSFVKRLNLAINSTTPGKDSYREDVIRNHTTLGGILDFTDRGTHRGPLDSITYVMYTQEREPTSFMSGTLNYTESSDSLEIGIYDKLKPLLTSKAAEQSVYDLQAENDDLREHIRRLSMKMANAGRNKVFGDTVSSQRLGSTVSLNTRPDVLQEEMDNTYRMLQAEMDEYNYYVNRLKQMEDPMYRKQLEDRKNRVIDETNMIRKLVKNAMKRADMEEKDLHAIREGKKYPEIMREVNVKQGEINKIQRKIDELKKKNREFEREREVKEEIEKELEDRYEGLLYMEGYYRGASVSRMEKQEKKYEETRNKRSGSLVRTSNDGDGYRKQMEDTKQKYARQQIIAEIESLALRNKQEREHLSKLEEISREQREMIYSMLEREKSESVEVKRESNEKIQKQKEFLTPAKQNKADIKDYTMQVLREVSLENQEDKNSGRDARKSESPESVEGPRVMSESMKNHIRIRKIDVASPNKEKVEQKVEKKDETTVLKVKEEKTSVVRNVPVKMEEGITEKYSHGKLKLIQMRDTLDSATSCERREEDVMQKKVETIDMGTSYDGKEEEAVVIKNIETVDMGTSYDERGVNMSADLNLSEVKEKSQKARQSPVFDMSREIVVANLSTRDELKDEKEASMNGRQEQMEISERSESPREDVEVSMDESVRSQKPKEESLQVVELELVEKEEKQAEIVQPVSVEDTVVEEKLDAEVINEEERVTEEPIVIVEEKRIMEVDEEVAKELYTKPALFKKSPEKKLKMLELFKETSVEKEALCNVSDQVECEKKVEIQEPVKVQEEAIVEEEARKEAESSQEGAVREPEVLVLPECVLTTKKSLFANNNDDVNEEKKKEDLEAIPIGEEDGVSSEQKNEEIEGSSTTRSQNKTIKLGTLDRMNTIRKGNNDMTPKKELTLSKQSSQNISEMSTSKSRMGIKPFIMPARKLVISKTTKKPQLVDKQDGIAAMKKISEARSDPFTELSSSQYLVSQNSSMLMQESILVRPGKVSVAVGTDEVFAGTGKLVENLDLGREKGVREMSLDFERKMREKTMGKEIMRPVAVVTSHGNEVMCQTDW